MAHVYLLHIEPAVKHAGHYCGYTPNGVDERLNRHLKGTGARLTQVAVQAGCKLSVVRTWEFPDRHEARLYERALKNTHNLRRYCPVCREYRYKGVSK